MDMIKWHGDAYDQIAEAISTETADIATGNPHAKHVNTLWDTPFNTNNYFGICLGIDYICVCILTYVVCKYIFICLKIFIIQKEMTKYKTMDAITYHVIMPFKPYQWKGARYCVTIHLIVTTRQ